MKISDAALLLDGLGRYFTEVYKTFDYKDDADLRDYLDFVVHEPAEWMRGFPAKWKTATTFYRPRAAFHKLLKHATVIEELGAEYCERVDGILWRAFKEDGPKILAKRGASAAAAVVAAKSGEVSAEGSDCGTPRLEVLDDAVSVASRHSIRRIVKGENVVIACPVIPVQPATTTNQEDGKWRQKFEVLYSAYLALLGEGSRSSEGVRGWTDTSEADRLRRSATLLAEALRSSV
jgi:hypothetical protein